MAPVSRKYDETKLGPKMMPEAWWYSLPSQTRTRIRRETGLEPTAGVYIGSVQDRLIALGLHRLANRFMEAMQAAHDAAEAGGWGGELWTSIEANPPEEEKPADERVGLNDD